MATRSNAWRFEQGRSTYFCLDNLKETAAVFLKHDGANMSGAEGTDIDLELRSRTGLPFRPSSYRVLRNYGRLYKLVGILEQASGQIQITKLGKRLAEEQIDYDEYFVELSKILTFPSPAFPVSFKEFGEDPPEINPIKLLARCLAPLASSDDQVEEQGISVDWIYKKLSRSLVSGNEADGFDYQNLKETEAETSGDDESTSKRQIREFLQFISQASFFKFYNSTLYLDVEGPEELNCLLRDLNITESITTKSEDKAVPVANTRPTSITLQDDTRVFEGGKKEVFHRRTERSPLLRKLYIRNSSNPYTCRMCDLDTSKIHPDIESLIEVHHLLPLSSNIRNDENGTTLSDVVGLCPNCHRIIHRVYSKYLKNKNREDFRDGDEAKELFNDVRLSVSQKTS